MSDKIVLTQKEFDELYTINDKKAEATKEEHEEKSELDIQIEYSDKALEEELNW